jgi:hypothetical protein
VALVAIYEIREYKKQGAEAGESNKETDAAQFG